MEARKYTMDFAGRPLTFEFGRYAELAAGSVLLRYGDTVVMVNVTYSETPREGQDFFPLSVDFEEKRSNTRPARFPAALSNAKPVPQRRRY